MTLDDARAEEAPAPDVDRVDRSVSTRDRLLEAAIAVIDEHGEVGVRVTEISDAAGVTRPSLYHFFGSREGLIVAAQAERYRRSIGYSNRDLRAVLATATTRDEYIKVLDRLLRTFGAPDGIARRRVRREAIGAAVFRPELARLIDEIDRDHVRRLVEIFREGRGSEWVTSPYDLDAVMLWWLGTIHGRQFIDEGNDERVSLQWNDIVSRSVIRVLFGADAAGDPGPDYRF